MSNSEGTYTTTTSSSTTDGEPVSNANDEELQQEVQGQTTSDEAGDQEIQDMESWGGMQSGAVTKESSQEHEWLKTIPSEYKSVAAQWAAQRGVVKITPLEQKQRFTYATVSYIASKQEEPKTQIFPISDVQVVPHQINWGFYSTTEGRIGVSHAEEKHMSVEFDVYLSELIATYWAFGEDNQYEYGLETFMGSKKRWWDAVENGTYLDFEEDLESQKSFIDFRNTFLQQHNGWVCRFASHTFGVFQGVISDVSYSIGNGESFAKWHVKIEEALFMNYSPTGQKEEAQTSDDGSTADSGDAANTEDVQTSG